MVEIIIRGNRVDTDKNTRLGLKFTGGIFRVADNELTRSFGLSVPKTEYNSQLFDYDGNPVMEGVRTSAECVIMSGGVVFDGLIYLQSYGGDRFELLFVEKRGNNMLSQPLSAFKFTDTITVDDKDIPTGGTIPNFGWYNYNNGTYDGLQVGNPVTLYPSTNLDYLIQEAASAAGYTVNYINDGSVYEDAANYGIVIPTMDTYSEAILKVDGSGNGGFTYTISTGQTLADIGLSIVARTFKKGLIGANITVYTFTALRHIKVWSNETFWTMFSGGVGKKSDWYNSYIELFEHFALEMDAGDYFTLISRDDIYDGLFTDCVNLIGGYESAIHTTTITVFDNDGVAGSGETIDLRNNLPDMTLSDLLTAYCHLTCASWTVNDDTRTIDVETFRHAINNTGAHIVGLDNRKIIGGVSVERFLGGFQQHNHVRCKSASYVTEVSRFDRDYPCANDILDEDSEYAVIPFSEGNWHLDNGDRVADFEDVSVGDNGDYNYKGVCSMFFANLNGGAALHLQTINDVGGMGVDFAAFTRQAVTIKLTVAMSLAEFAAFTPSTIARLKGRDYIVRTAEWSENACQLELVRLEI